MAPEVAIEGAPRPKHIIMIRANAAQTATLRKAFAISDVASSELLKTLSEETTLPEKWIHQWFGRQRAKERKSKAKATALAPGFASNPNPSGSTSVSANFPASSLSVGGLPSAQEILRVKLENHDPVPASLLDPLPPPLPEPDWSSPGAPNGSKYVTTSVSAFSSAPSSALLDRDRLPSVLAPAPAVTGRKKRGRVPKNQNQNQNENEAQTARTVRTRRAKGKGRIAVIESLQPSLVKTEFVEPSAKLSHTPQPADSMDALAVGSGLFPASHNFSQPPANSASGFDLDPGFASAPDHYTQLVLPMVTPAKRSLLASATMRRGSLRYPRPSLSSNHCDSIYLPLPQQNSSAPTLSSRSRRPALPSYRQGPVFRTRFLNNGPANYSPESVSNVPSGSTNLFLPPASDDGFAFSGLNTIPSLHQDSFSNCYVSGPLAPAFDWENHVPSEASIEPPGAGHDISQIEYHFAQQNFPQLYEPQYQQTEYLSHEAAVYREPIDFSSSHQIVGAPLLTPLQQSDSFDEFLQGTALDPSMAPLKHLTDVLENFKDGHGTYIRLMVEQERENVMKCLLDERLVEMNPFQAAMGLSLLSKLGVEWEM